MTGSVSRRGAWSESPLGRAGRALPNGTARPPTPDVDPQPLEEEFEGFVASTYDTVFRTAWRKSGDRDLSQDFTQEAFLRLWKHRVETGNQVWTAPYAVQTVKNIILDHHRRQRGTVVPMAAEHLSDHPHGEDTYDWERSMSTAVRNAFDRLPVRQRQVVDAVVLQGITPAELARTMNLDRQTVYDYKRMGLRRLARLLSGKTE
ncbi:RNA polymerase sigma factor [Actinokineospora diospyrosa]|uniref:RNA polymerase sigma-70 factor, ECF subfamily n=1 Tax=Actinokineospora diospyrosa TaxID=103728 RepID=A0ABT1ICH0_9PSEU|nr:sigma-70 family RNA polymerase sigma factor [Actinokineospora diospyrosa]MCP2270323.1 RNA polymerase sigma-70 factor, ECF subfamily [Actinokineospora diospyrosa]